MALEPLNGAEVKRALDLLFDGHAATRRTNVAAKVVDLQTGQTLFERRSELLMTPASNLKIYTTAAALDLLGPDFQGSLTRLVVTPDGVYLIGGGAAMIATQDLRRWAVEALAGDAMTGAVEAGSPRRLVNVVPDAWVELPSKGPGWMWDDEPDYYNMSISALMVDFNTLEVRVAAPSEPSGSVEATLTPKADYPPVINRATVAGADEAEAREPIKIDRLPFTNAILIDGSLAPGEDDVVATITMHDPDRWVAEVFATILRDASVAIDEVAVQHGGETEILNGPHATLHEFASKPLREVVKHFNRVSENAIGEMLLLRLGEAYGDLQRFGEGLSWPRGADVITTWLTDAAGLSPGSFRLVDGSGLSRYNLINADSSVRLLSFMHRHEHAKVFVDSLPTYSIRFDENEVWAGKPLETINPQRVFAKPGGMSGVYTVSGYLDTLDGRRLAFSFLTNGFVGSSIASRDLRDLFWSTLAQYRPTAADSR